MPHPRKQSEFVDREVLVLTRRGLWLADGEEITHEPTRATFARSLKKGAKGYYLHIGRETKAVEVEDTALFVERLGGSATQGWVVYLSDQTQEPLQPQTLSYRPGRLTCRVKPDPQASPNLVDPTGLAPLHNEEALFLSAPYMELLRDLKTDANGYYLEIQGARIALAPLTVPTH